MTAAGSRGPPRVAGRTRSPRPGRPPGRRSDRSGRGAPCRVGRVPGAGGPPRPAIERAGGRRPSGPSGMPCRGAGRRGRRPGRSRPRRSAAGRACRPRGPACRACRRRAALARRLARPALPRCRPCRPRRRGSSGRGRSATGRLHGPPPALPVARVLDGDAMRRRARRAGGRTRRSPARPGPRRAPRAAPPRPARARRPDRRRTPRTRSMSRSVSSARPASAVDSERRSSRRLRSRTRSNTTASAADAFRSSSSAAPNPSRAASSASSRVRIVRPLLRVRPEGRDRRVQPVEGGRRRRERFVGVVEAGPVVDRDERQPERPRRDAGRQQVAGPGDVAGRLGHLGAVHLEVGAMQPGRDERLAGGGLALGDLVLVVREDEVDRRRCGGRTTDRGGSCSSPSIRCASPAGRARWRSPTTARPASAPSTGRSRGRRPCRIRRPRPAPPPGDPRGRAGPARP